MAMKIPAHHRDMENLKQDVQIKFAEIRNALHMREKLLLRQADVIVQQTKQQHQQQQLRHDSSSIQNNVENRDIKFLAEFEDELLTAIRNFGRFQLDNINLTLQDVYLRNEDYITPANDHETMYKCLQQSINSSEEANKMDLDNENENQNEQEFEQPEAIVVDFSRNKSLIEHNTKHMNKSIISITLQEAKELIKKAKMRRETPIPPLNLEELADELESSIADAVSSLSAHDESLNTDSKEERNTKSSKKTSTNRFKPKITINNCNGTINLRNISNLTINCTTEDSISAQIPLQTHTPHETETQEEELNSSSSHDQINAKNMSKSSCTNITNTTQKSPTVVEAIVSTTDESPAPSITASSSNYSNSSSSRSQSKKNNNNSINKKFESSQSRTYPYDIIDYDERDNIESSSHTVTCDFYNRLLKEIKNSLRTKRTNENLQYNSSANQGQENIQTLETNEASDSKSTNVPEHKNNESNSNCSSYISIVQPSSTCNNMSTTSQPGAGRRLVLKNFENLRIVLEANSSDEESFHPVQIEQWLAEIISETDLEPMQNTDILEHSELHNETT